MFFLYLFIILLFYRCSHIKSTEDISSGYSSAENSASLTRTSSVGGRSRARTSRTTITTIKRPQAAEVWLLFFFYFSSFTLYPAFDEVDRDSLVLGPAPIVFLPIYSLHYVWQKWYTYFLHYELFKSTLKIRYNKWILLLSNWKSDYDINNYIIYIADFIL